MSEECGYSPSFKRPSEIMRMRRKRARSEAFPSPGGHDGSSTGQTSPSPPSCVRPFAPGPLFSKLSRTAGAAKRRNPFANIENRFGLTRDDGKDDKMEATPAGDSTTEAEDMDVPACSSFTQSCLNASAGSEGESLFEGDAPTPLVKAVAPLSPAPPLCTEYPADWSLKTRLLFSSSLTLSWSEQPKAQEEALGLSQHCRTQFTALPHSLQDARSCSELRCAFQQSLIYWQHPSLPWVPLFPRMDAERRFAGTSAPWAHDVALQQSLMSEWSASLSSLYGLLKARRCPYFYVCAHQFTVLFRAAGVGGSSSITATLSPTSRGFRDAMKADGIHFTLPLLEERRKTREQRCRSEQDEDCWDGDEDGGSGLSWLEEIGVQDKIRKPDSISMQLKEGRAASLDHKPESVVCLEGAHTFTLINFLINCKSVVATAGSQAGLPPTLLAPLAFRGAAMHTLKARCVNMKSQVGSTYHNVSSLEIAGPVLPSSLHAITALLGPAQKGNFSATLYTHTPTAVLNVHCPQQQCGSGSADLSQCGLHPASVQQLQRPSGLGKTALTQINMKDYSYTWKS
ncbi:protein downstream neighbor of son homolog isoform X2 [Dunckerocampus dactyliophorus]|uniref:protein downstream neighbor of son homolog isoform X2 n=1 Tax=Dunckerocampus dactyliophorus TaxID=161453 RepID=UPI002405A86F|nr:protein downstream neighbor of son homolog isoform X2 [Dunckerocampus dactyliophorus]